ERSPQRDALEETPDAQSSGPPALPDAPGAIAPPPLPAEAPAPVMDVAPTSPDGPALLPADDLFAETEDELPAPAEHPQLLRPTDKRRFFSLSGGAATGSSGYLSYYGGGSGLGFASEMMIGAYGKRRSNLGGAFVMQYRKGTVTELSLAGRFRARKRLTKEFALYTVFDTTVGVSIPLALAGYFYPMIPSAQLGIGWGLEAILAERVTLGLRPFAPSIIAPNFYNVPPVSLRWEFGVSMGIVW
ncbi:MAG: hypothetical protein KUG77_26285, partial [Nannocystaceae bacterium]|nr:hypothetical protein [Nannocystaceae bacterium]